MRESFLEKRNMDIFLGIRFSIKNQFMGSYVNCLCGSDLVILACLSNANTPTHTYLEKQAKFQNWCTFEFLIKRCPVSFSKLISSGFSDPFRYFKDRAILKIYVFISFWENGFILTNYLGLQGQNESTLYSSIWARNLSKQKYFKNLFSFLIPSKQLCIVLAGFQ